MHHLVKIARNSRYTTFCIKLRQSKPKNNPNPKTHSSNSQNTPNSQSNKSLWNKNKRQKRRPTTIFAKNRRINGQIVCGHTETKWIRKEGREPPTSVRWTAFAAESGHRAVSCAAVCIRLVRGLKTGQNKERRGNATLRRRKWSDTKGHSRFWVKAAWELSSGQGFFELFLSYDCNG